jgi:hypothetical protein
MSGATIRGGEPLMQLRMCGTPQLQIVGNN